MRDSKGRSVSHPDFAKEEQERAARDALPSESQGGASSAVTGPTIYVAGPQGCGKTRWAEHLRREAPTLDALPRPTVVDMSDMQPAAWQYELATYLTEGGKYAGWQWALTTYKPCVPKGSIRNLTPLYDLGA